MLAAMNGHTAAVKLLLDMGSDINAQIETNRNTALTLACFQGRTEVVSLLLDRKANVEHRAKVRRGLRLAYGFISLTFKVYIGNMLIIILVLCSNLFVVISYIYIYTFKQKPFYMTRLSITSLKYLSNFFFFILWERHCFLFLYFLKFICLWLWKVYLWHMEYSLRACRDLHYTCGLFTATHGLLSSCGPWA